jgi:hypothetical protein
VPLLLLYLLRIFLSLLQRTSLKPNAQRFTLLLVATASFTLLWGWLMK